MPADGQSAGALLGMTAGASSFNLEYSAIRSTALKAFSATLASRTVMEVREVIWRAYDSVRPICDAAPLDSMARTAAEKAARAPRVSRRTLNHLQHNFLESTTPEKQRKWKALSRQYQKNSMAAESYC